MSLFVILSTAGIKIDITDLPGISQKYLNSYFIGKANKYKILGNQLLKNNYVKHCGLKSGGGGGGGGGGVGGGGQKVKGQNGDRNNF